MSKKAGMLALAMAGLDLLAIAVIGYVATLTMNLVMWSFLLLLGLIFAYDAYKAVTFVVELIKYNKK